MNNVIVNEKCVKCIHVTKIVDYMWNLDHKCYMDKIKTIGWLCNNKEFKRKYYRKGYESLGKNCKLFEESKIPISEIHNNRIIKTNQERKLIARG